MARWRWNVPPSALGDAGSRDAADRIWARLEEELPARVPAASPPRSLAWALGVAAAFVCGVWVGSAYENGSGRAGPTALRAEPLATPMAPVGPVTAGPEPALDASARVDIPDVPRRGKRIAVPLPEPVAEEEEGLNTVLELPASAPAEGPLVGVEPAPASSAWQLLAEQGNYPGALAEIRSRGGFESVLAAANSEQLMLLVDVARATGQRQLAVVALRRVVEEYRQDPLAPLAAWSLGVMLEKEGDRAGAATAYGVYRSLSPQGDFAEDALARQVRIAMGAGELAQAQGLAREYVTTYPTAPRSEEFRQWLAQNVARVAGETAAAETLEDGPADESASDEGSADEGAADEGSNDRADEEGDDETAE